MLTELLVILALIVANGLFSGAEMAIVAVRSSRVRELMEGGRRAAIALHKLREDPERFLSTVQIGITVVSATAAAFGGAAFASDLEPAFRGVPALEDYAEELALALVVVLVSFLSVVLGELVPKSLALRMSERYALLAARPLLAISFALQPAVWLLTKSSNLVLLVFGDRTTFTETRLSLEELRTLVDEASHEGSLPAQAGQIASRAFEFVELTASDVMVHRRFVVGLPSDASAEQVRRTVLERGHQRIPVFEGTLDNVVGYVSWRDLVRRVWEGGAIVLSEMLRPCHFVPESRTALDLLEEMRRERVHLAIVVDEHGGTAGIVTLEDLLEELVGEITSEHSAQDAPPIRRESDGSALVAGATPIRDVNRELDLGLDEPEDWGTLGGLCTYLAGGRIPRSGERFRAKDGTELEIVDASARRIRLVRVRKSVAAGTGT
jgi:putative hemolysin